MKLVTLKSRRTNEISHAFLVETEADLKIMLKEKAADLTTAYMECKDASAKGFHTSHLAFVVGATVMSKEGRQSFVDDVMQYCTVLLKPYIDTFNKYGGLYSWQNVDRWTKKYKYAGFTPKIDGIFETMGLDLVSSVDVTHTNFPRSIPYTKSDISVTKWPEGRHYYAKVGDIDVEIDGKRKWNTHEYAYKMAEKFLDTLK